MKLRPFKPSDASVITSWLKDEYTFLLWSAGRFPSYPLTAEKLIFQLESTADPRCLNMTALSEKDEAIAFLSIRLLPKNDEARLCSIVVSDRERGRGLGRQLITAAAEYAFSVLSAKKISIAVFSQNEKAIACYRSVGFRFDEGMPDETRVCAGEVWTLRHMILEKTAFSQA